MRTELKNIENERHTFVAKVGSFGVKYNRYTGHYDRTLCLQDVTTRGKKMTDHLWFTMGKRLDDLALAEGDQIEFNATAKAYVKGRWGEWVEDYKLSNPTRLKVVARSGNPPHHFSPPFAHLAHATHAA